MVSCTPKGLNPKLYLQSYSTIWFFFIIVHLDIHLNSINVDIKSKHGWLQSLWLPVCEITDL